MKAQMQKGFTLIELMIVVAIIGILPRLHYLPITTIPSGQQTGLAWPKLNLYMTTAIADLSAGRDAVKFEGTACAAGTAPTETQYNENADIKFTPVGRGNTELLQETSCEAGTGTCKLLASSDGDDSTDDTTPPGEANSIGSKKAPL